MQFIAKIASFRSFVSFYSDEEKSVPIEVFLTTGDEEKGVCALNCSLEYFDVVQCKSTKVESSIRIEVSEEDAVPKPVESSVVGDIRIQILRCEIVQSLVKATELADRGNIHEARELLNHCKRLVHATPKTTLLTQHLLETIEESLSGLEDKDVYKRHGKPTMMQYLHSHGQQRSSSNPSKHGYDSESRRGGEGGVGATAITYVSPVWAAEDDCVNPYMNQRKKAMKVAFANAHKKK